MWLAVGYWNAVWRQVKLSLLSPSSSSPLSPFPHSSLFFPCLSLYLSVSLSLSPFLHPMEGMQDHVLGFLFNQSFLFICLSFTLLAASVSLFISFLSPSMFRPVLFCMSELILNFEPTHHRLCEWESYVHLKGRAWGGHAVKRVSMLEQTVFIKKIDSVCPLSIIHFEFH